MIGQAQVEEQEMFLLPTGNAHGESSLGEDPNLVHVDEIRQEKRHSCRINDCYN